MASHPRRDDGRTGRRSDRFRLILAFGIAVLVGTVYVLVRPTPPFGMLAEEPRIAAHLARGHGFLSPIDPSPSAEPTSWSAPVYPYLMAGMYRLLGVETLAAIKAMMVLNAVFFGFLAAGAYRLGQRLFRREVGIAAAALVVLNPLFVLRLYYCWDTYLAMALLVWLVIAAEGMGRRRPGARALALLGAGLGLVALARVSLALAFPIVVLVALRPVDLRRKAVLAAVSLAAFLLVIAPWTIRNYVVFDEIIVIRGTPQVEMWIGNLPGSSGWMDLARHPMLDEEENARIREMGEREYAAFCGERFREDYRADPGAFWMRTLRRVGYVFVGERSGRGVAQTPLGAGLNRLRVIWDAGLTLLTLAGFVLAWRLGYRRIRLLGLALASVAPALVSHMSYRYAMPARFFLLFFVAFLLAALYLRVRSGRWPDPESQRAPITTMNGSTV